VRVGEFAHSLHASRELFGRRGIVKDCPILFAHHNVLIRAPKSTCLTRIIERIVGNQTVYFKNEIGSERLVLQLPQPLHGLVVVHDHLLTAVARLSA
jgi:hypothetical protein